MEVAAEPFKFKWRSADLTRYNWTSRRKKTLTTVNQGDENVMVWGWFAASEPRQFSVIKSNTHSALYESVLDVNVGPSAQKVKLNRKIVFQHNADLKYISKSTKKSAQKKK